MVNRARERGVAIFIVVMVLTMLTAIGIFAMKAASMANMASGYERQSAQNELVSDYGMMAAAAELGTNRASGHYNRLTKGADTCAVNRNVQADGGILHCYHLYAADIQRNVTVPLFAPTTRSATVVQPGSLGPTPFDGDFDVEVTDPGPAAMMVAGEDLGKSKSNYRQVTLTSTGQVRPVTGDAGSLDPVSCAAAGNKTGRVFARIGPVQ